MLVPALVLVFGYLPTLTSLFPTLNRGVGARCLVPHAAALRASGDAGQGVAARQPGALAHSWVLLDRLAAGRNDEARSADGLRRQGREGHPQGVAGVERPTWPRRAGRAGSCGGGRSRSTASAQRSRTPTPSRLLSPRRSRTPPRSPPTTRARAVGAVVQGRRSASGGPP